MLKFIYNQKIKIIKTMYQNYNSKNDKFFNVAK